MLGSALAFALGVPAPARAQPGALDVHRATRNTLRGGVKVVVSRLRSRPAGQKSYPEAPRIALPPAHREPALSLPASVRGAPPPPAFAEAPLAPR